MIGDDNFLNIAAFDLNYEISYLQKPRGRLRHCGNCISGLRIRQATELIRHLDDSVGHVIINVGSVDIAEGRELIEMIADLKELLNTCEQYSISPILTTLPPLANYLVGMKKDILIGFNNILRHNFSNEYPVIDLNLCMLKYDGTADFDAFQPMARHVSGSSKPFVLWNRQGRKRVHRMIVKNLGHALFFTNYLGEHF